LEGEGRGLFEGAIPACTRKLMSNSMESFLKA